MTKVILNLTSNEPFSSLRGVEKYYLTNTTSVFIESCERLYLKPTFVETCYKCEEERKFKNPFKQGNRRDVARLLGKPLDSDGQAVQLVRGHV